MDQPLIEGLKYGNSDTLKTIYLNYKSDFILFAKKYPLNETTIVDIYQDAIIALRENALNGKLDTLNSELKTYLFSIGKYMIYKKIKLEKNTYTLEETNKIYDLQCDFDFSIDLVQELTNQQKQLRLAFRSLGKKCKEILTLFYYRGFDLEDITNSLNYTNKDVVKSQKSRCLKSLKDMILKQ